MKRKISFLIFFTIFVVTLIINTKANASDIQTGNYSEKYKEWIQLPESEKQGKIAPLPFNIRKESNYVTTVKRKMMSIVKNSQIPEQFDLRDEIEVTVKNQQLTNSCWAFSANASIETYLALRGEKYDFSERHMEYETSKSFSNGVNPNALNREVGVGGYSTTAFTYYSRGSGPILEEDMPFQNKEDKIEVEELPTNITVKKVDDMVYFPNIFKQKQNDGSIIYKDANNNSYNESDVLEIRNQIKEHIMKYGGVSASVSGATPYTNHYNASTHADNVTDPSIYADHAVIIIGWDDNYSRENFTNKPSNDGAYIVLNSWGQEYGDNGVYYVSYEDMLIENQMRGITSVSDIQYDNIYQYDTSEMYDIQNSQYAANVFSIKDDEKLTEIVIGSWSEQTCDIYINTIDGDLNVKNATKIASNVKLQPGYNTIKIQDNIELIKDDKFSIIVKLTNYGYEGIGVECNINGLFGSAISHEGESFVSNNGINWEDMYNPNDMRNLSIKAYTQKNERYFDIEDIKENVYENTEGTCTLKISTSYLDNNKNIEVKILKNNNDITNEFKIENCKVKGKGALIKIEYPNSITQGTYDIQLQLDGYETQTKQLYVLKEGEDPTEEDDINLTSNIYNIQNSIISRVNAETTVENVKKELTTNATTLIFYDKDQNLLSNNDFVTTETFVVASINNKTKIYRISVVGDITGDGKIDLVDVSRVRMHEDNVTPLSTIPMLVNNVDLYELSADIDGDGKITIIDASKIRLHEDDVVKLY